VFPHHENEVAQSCAANRTSRMANFWMHNGFLQVDGEKMSKSLGNFVTIHELLTSWRGKPWAGSVLRLAMLSTHYRQPIDWTYDLLERARLELAEWCQAVLPEMFTKYDPYGLAWEEGFEPPAEIVNALYEDLNFPSAHSEIRKLHSSSLGNNEEDRLKLLMALQFLGFIKKNTVGALSGRLRGNVLAAANSAQIDDLRALQVHVANNQTTEVLSRFQAFRSLGVTAEPDDQGIITIEYEDGGANLFERLIAQRDEARKAKNWAEADRIRDELAAMGIALKDAKDPATGEIVTTWEIAR
jgi:cysteinyl-tRNA synthetase